MATESGRPEWWDHRTPNKIIDAAERLLEDRDIRSIAVEDILTEAEVARGTFYSWFDNKFDLIGKAYLRASTGIVSAADRWVAPANEGRDPRARLEELFSASIQSWQQHGPVLRAVQDTWRTEPAVANHWLPGLRWARAIVAREVAAVNGRERRNAADRMIAGALVNLSEQTLYQASIDDDFSLGDGVRDTIAAIWYQAIYELPHGEN